VMRALLLAPDVVPARALPGRSARSIAGAEHWRDWAGSPPAPFRARTAAHGPDAALRSARGSLDPFQRFPPSIRSRIPTRTFDVGVGTGLGSGPAIPTLRPQGTFSPHLLPGAELRRIRPEEHRPWILQP